MKKLISIFLALVILSGCAPQPTPVDPNLLYTEAAKTVFVQMTSVAALTPSATITPSPVPTATATLTPIPSPTPVPPTPTFPVVPAGKVTAPILLYYRVAGNTSQDPNYQWDSAYYIPPEVFRQQLEVLKSAGYSSVTVSQLVDVVRKGGSLPPKPIVFTFEAAAVSLYTTAYPIMKDFGFVGTVYAVVTQVDGKGMMKAEQMKELVAAGWEFGSKGMTDTDITANHEQAGYEISTSRTELSNKIGVEVKSFSYPFGKTDDIVNGARVSGWGYQSAVGMGRSSEISEGNLYFLPRYEMRKDITIDQFAAMLPWQPASLPTQFVVTKQVP